MFWIEVSNKFLKTDICFPGIGEGVRFSLRGTTYQNNSLVTLEDIGEWANALLCITDKTTCCHPSYSGEMGAVIGNWFFPNGTRVPNKFRDNPQWDFYRTRDQMIVHMHRRRGGVTGIYHCKILDAMNVTQTIYIGVYTANTGELSVKIQFGATVICISITRHVNCICIRRYVC